MNSFDFFVIAQQLAAVPPPQPDQVVVLYLGPDSVLPLASIIAAVVGVILMFGRTLIGFFRRGFNTVLHKEQEVLDAPPPPQDQQPN